MSVDADLYLAKLNDLLKDPHPNFANLLPKPHSLDSSATSVADPNPGYGAFLTPGSRIRDV
jgi:hypothetical protein